MNKKSVVILVFTLVAVYGSSVSTKACSYGFCSGWQLACPQRLGIGRGYPGLFNPYCGHPSVFGGVYDAGGFYGARYYPPPSPTIIVIRCRERSKGTYTIDREQGTAKQTRTERVSAWKAEKDGAGARVPLIIEVPRPSPNPH